MIKTEQALLAQGITKSFGNRLALKGIDLSVLKGELVVIFGPNGAGKTTLLRILATIMNPTSGTVVVDGMSSKTQTDKVRRQIGVIGHQTSLYGDLTIKENLDFYCRLYNIKGKKERIAEVVDMVGMTARLYDRVCTLSRGMQQRVAIARAILHRPMIMLMDEPETGLDQNIMSVLWKTLRLEGEVKRTMIMTTHSFERGLDVGDRFIIISRGQIVYECKKELINPTQFKETYEQVTGIVL